MTDFAGMIAAYNKAEDARQVVLKDIGANMEAQLKLAVQDIFDRCPSLSHIVWTQYTPYFNDGETCTFGVHEITAFGPQEDDNHPELDQMGYGEGDNVFSSHLSNYYYEQACISDEEWVSNAEARRPPWKQDPYTVDDRSTPQEEAISIIHEYERAALENPDRSAVLEFVSELSKLPDPVMEMTFGDGVLVHIYRGTAGKVVIETHEHDHD